MLEFLIMVYKVATFYSLAFHKYILNDTFDDNDTFTKKKEITSYLIIFKKRYCRRDAMFFCNVFQKFLFIHH